MMATDRLVEVVVRAEAGERADDVAQEWARRLDAGDGVRIVVMRGERPTRPRRFVVLAGRIASPHHYAALSIADAVHELLRGEGRPMDAWEILLAARRRGSPVGSVPVATIARAARLLQRAGRLRHGPRSQSWVVPADEVAA